MREPDIYQEPDWFAASPPTDLGWQDVRGMNGTVDAVVAAVAAAGPHGAIVLVGPPGIGKTMIARRIPLILPDPTVGQRAQIRAEFEAAGLGRSWLTGERPFRAPHHTISRAAMMGVETCGRFWTGPRTYRTERYSRAGEYQLARHGVLMLDELPEFRRDVLQGLAERRKCARPSPLIVATAQACPCGWHYPPQSTRACTSGRECACTHEQRERWDARVVAAARLIGAEGPRIEIPIISMADMKAALPGRPTAELRERIASAAWSEP